MKLEDLQAFVTLIQLQSTLQTAAKLGLTQPAVTRRVQNFEESLGVVLLDRQTKPLRPTTVGLQVYQQCQRIISEVDSLLQLVAEDAPPHGVLRLGMPHSLADDSMLPALAQLQQRYPDLQPRLSSGWGNQLLQQLQQGQLDAALLLFPASKVFPQNLLVAPLGKVELAIVAADDGQPLPQTLAECYGRGWILNPDGCGFRAAITRALADRGLPLQLNMEVQGSALQLALIAAGRGLGMMPRMLVDRAPASLRLKVVELSDFSPVSELWLVQRTLPASQLAALAQFGSDMAAEYGLLSSADNC
ncbi:LysR family transcriptional regulator [Erwiniaceae bacterium BAC15a-03b]|uniref:LysR family transcriptional regulator n=1 Tax=Winslowiella arboricola TaxID=2978220 RepID=A0A9J6PR07_9GAMM|nr:LysR family transcriptional regulator [Winslowiella arboricola]MCU5771368.1 LysR family transcriptional regulator [Winslowiella arboricola]MCU5777180.1 LysR family transcriptional regulator [Winslowiella arboricola]